MKETLKIIKKMAKVLFNLVIESMLVNSRMVNFMDMVSLLLKMVGTTKATLKTTRSREKVNSTWNQLSTKANSMMMRWREKEP